MGRPQRREPIPINVRVGRVIKEMLVEQGMTLSVLADRAVVDLSSLSRALNGHEGITLHRFEKLAHVLEVEPAELLERAARVG